MNRPGQHSGVRTRFAAGALLLTLLGVTLGGWVWPRLHIETDLLALLPRHEGDTRTDAALDAFSERLSRKIIYLVGAAEPQVAKNAARIFAARLRGSAAFESVQEGAGAPLDELKQLYAKHHAFLLSRRQQNLLEAGEAEQIYRDALTAVYTPAGLFRPLGLLEDPLGLGSDYLLAQVPATGAAAFEDGQLIVREGERTFVVIAAEVAGSVFSADVQEKVQQARRTAQTAAANGNAQVSVLSSGVLEYATPARRKAQSEISLFGTVDTLFVLGLMLALFRSWRAPALGLLALGAGGAAGLVAAHFIFGTVHLIALVFGTSLIGVAIDYAMHFFSDQYRAPRQWSPPEALSHVGRPILLGLAVALTGYLALVPLPFPGLKQMAVISIAGLVVACACVFLIFPALARGSGRELPAWCDRALHGIDALAGKLRDRRVLASVAAGLLIVTVIGLMRLQPQDDLRALQTGDPQVSREEQQVREILRGDSERRFFLVTAKDAEENLRAEERLTAALDQLIAQRKLENYQAVTRALPSLARQREVHALLQRHVYAPDGILPRFMQELGFTPQAANKAQTGSVAQEPLMPGEWWNSSIARNYRHLWLGEVGTEHATVVMLEGIHDIQAVRVAADKVSGARFIDRVQEISAVLAHYRHTVLMLLLAIYGIVFIALAVRYGPRAAGWLVSAPAGATLLTLALAGWVGLPLTLFSALALLLLLGLGVDYAIFLREAGAERRTALLAITLSAMTTMISFGLLSFSSTPLISSIGVTLGMGIASCWLLAVAADALRNKGIHER